MSFQASSRSRPFQTDITKFSGRVRGNRSSHACSRDRMQSEETMKFSDNRVTGVIQCLQQPHYHLWREIESRIISRCLHAECVRVDRPWRAKGSEARKTKLNRVPNNLEAEQLL